MKKENNNLKIILTVGIPASGKSTWAKNFIKNNENWIRTSRDDFRLMLKNAQVCEPKIEDLITDLVDKVIENALNKKQNVIVDATNLKIKYIEHFNKFSNLADIDYRIFDISLKKAIERDNNRERKVGEEVIRRMYNDYLNIISTYSFQPIKKRPFLNNKVKPNTNGNAIIVDIDGTLTFMSDRDPYDYDSAINDELNPLMFDIINYNIKKGNKIILLTGRDEECRRITENWLELHNVKYDILLMRLNGDRRADYIVKREIYENIIKPYYDIICVYDDRLSVLKMWYDIGIYAFNVNQGNILF